MTIKRIITLITFIAIIVQVSAQVEGGTYEKLAKLYNSGKFEACFNKAESYTFREDYSKDAEPYLYISMCLLKILNTDDEEVKDYYQVSERDAVKYATRFTKKDKMRELYPLNLDYINEIKKIQKQVIKDHFNEGKYSKAASAAKLYNQLNQDKDNLVLFYVGMNQVMSNNLGQGQKSMEDGRKGVKTALKANKLVVDKTIKSCLIDGFMKYTEYLIKQSKIEEAKKVISFAKDVFPADGYIKVQYNVIFKE